MKRALALAMKETRDIMRERTIVMAVLVQLFVAAFSAFLAVGLLVLYNPGAIGGAPAMDVGYAGPGGLDDVIDASPTLDLVEMDREEGLAAFQEGRIDAFVEERYDDANGTRRISLTLPEGEVHTTLLVTELKTTLDDYERQLREERQPRLDRVVTYAETDATPEVAFAFAYSVLIPLLVATPVFLAGAISADSLSDEINEGTLLVLRSAPITPSEIVLGKLLAPVLLVPAQVGLWLALLWANGLPVEHVGVVLAASTILGTLLAGCGILVGAIAQREGPTQAGYTLLVLALALLSLLLPQDPANLIARASVGSLDAASLATLGIYAGLAAIALVLAVRVVAARMAADRLQPGVS